MGAFDDVAPILLPDPTDPVAESAFRKKWRWDAHEQVVLRGAYTAADQEHVTNASVAMTKKGDTTMHAGTGRTVLMDRMILDWTFVRNGIKVPKTRDAIGRLPANYTVPILAAIDKLSSAMSEEEQEDFFGSANGHSSDSSEEMKLSPSLF